MPLELPTLPDARASLDVLYPRFKQRALAAPYPAGAVALGRSGAQSVVLGRRARFEHTHVIGTTGGGKTNLLEVLLRQDIKNGDGVFLIDPHGNHPQSMYKATLSWIFANGIHRRRRVHLIDPNARSHVTGFNPLALPDPETSVSVIADTTLEAFERVWGDEDTHAKPTIRRVLKATFAALAESRLTLAEAELLFDPRDAKGVRALVLNRLTDRYAKAVLSDLDRIARTDKTGGRFRDEIIGPINRLAEFASSPAIRRIIGQRANTLDLREALDRGDIILANLSGGNAVSDADVELLGRLLTRFVFFHVKRRKTDRPFWLFVDECQRFLSGDIPSMLAESRKHATGVLLSHQWQSQLGTDEGQTLAAVHNATNLKVAFRIKHPKEAKELAEAIIPLDLERPVRALIKPTIVGHRHTWFGNWSEADSESWSTTGSHSETSSITESDQESFSESSVTQASWGATTSNGAAQSWEYPGTVWGPAAFTTPLSTTISTSADTSSQSGGSASSGTGRQQGRGRAVTLGSSDTMSESYTHGHSSSRGASEGLEPIYEDLPTAVHSLENVTYMAARELMSLTAGQAYVSFVDETGLRHAKVQVPLARPLAVTEKTYEAIRSLIFAKSGSAINAEDASAAVEAREEKLFVEGRQALGINTEFEEVENFRVPLKSTVKSK